MPCATLRSSSLILRDPDEVGELGLNKETDDVEMTKQSRQAFLLRASRKVSVAHKLGELPVLLEWAS